MQRNLSRSKNVLLTLGVYILLVLSFSGTLIGTYAWYSYDTRAKSVFNGTSINNQGVLKVGLYSEIPLYNPIAYGLIEDPTNPNVYWGNGGLSSNQLNHFLETNGYATNSIRPVTSGSRSVSDDLTLRPCPTELDNSYVNKIADKERYAYLPLVFKIEGETQTELLYFKDTNVRSDGKISDSLRIYTHSDYSQFLFAADLKDDGYDVVGGVLDLDLNDEYYDYEHGKEFVYGEFENVVYKSDVTVDEGEVEDPNTFNAKHKEGIYALDEENSTPKRAYYYGYDAIFNKQKAIAEVSGGITRVDLTIYIEGWNTSLHNSEISNSFNLDLTFEVGA